LGSYGYDGHPFENILTNYVQETYDLTTLSSLGNVIEVPTQEKEPRIISV